MVFVILYQKTVNANLWDYLCSNVIKLTITNHPKENKYLLTFCFFDDAAYMYNRQYIWYIYDL